MTHDKEGNLVPYMLSALVADAQKALQEHGDMPVWSIALYFGGDYGEYNCESSEPVSDPPKVGTPGGFNDYWPNRFQRAFILTSG